MAVKPSQGNDQTTDGVDPNSKEMQPILDNLQANILKAHGRNEAYHLFLRFTGDPDKVKAWIRAYAQDSHHVTSAAKQLQDAAKRKDNPNYTGGLLGCFFLSAAGYKALGFSIDQFEGSFQRGMKDHAPYTTDLGSQPFHIENKDPQPGDWQEDYQDEIHAMLLLAQNCNEINPSLEDTVKQVISSLDGIAKVFIEHGRRLLTHDGKDLEHFGYRDGISNPLFFKGEIKRKWGDRYDQSATLGLVLEKDPLTQEADCYGSYLVFRKLKQDVEPFNRQVMDLSRHVNKGNMEQTGAQIVGRFKDATPVTAHKSPQGSAAATNNFNYNIDADGRRCPVHAHIRKANPRDGNERSRRIVRRGIPYGKPGDAEVGLLFICYQSNIHDQFEFLQRVWVDNPNFPTKNAGDDPLVGQDNTQQQWPKEYNTPKADNNTHTFNFGGHVTLQGGEYFFAPSLSFLKNIHELSAIEQQLTNNLTALNGGQMSESKFVIIATYNHEAYRILKDPNPSLDQTGIARQTAVALFGARQRDGNGNLVIGKDGRPETIGGLGTNYFTFVGAFPDLKIPRTDPEADPDDERKREEYLYGWVAIVSGQANLEVVKEKIGWPDSRFCKVFNIMISEINPIEIEGNKPVEVEQDLQQKRRDPEAWKQKGFDIYEEQTPTSWKP